MPRIRTIKPETPEDEKLGQVSRDARLLFILLWTKCDDHGRFRASPIWLRNNLFPYDDDTAVVEWLSELAAIGRVRLYRVDGESYGLVENWSKHQRVDNQGKALYPEPPDMEASETPQDAPESAVLGDPPQSSANLGGLPLDLDLDLDLEGEATAAVGEVVVLPPLEGRLSAPKGFVELVDPGGPVAVRREAAAIIEAANQRAGPKVKLTSGERRKLHPLVQDWLTSGYEPDAIADAIASSPFRTEPAVLGELRKATQPQRNNRQQQNLTRIANELGNVAGDSYETPKVSYEVPPVRYT